MSLTQDQVKSNKSARCEQRHCGISGECPIHGSARGIFPRAIKKRRFAGAASRRRHSTLETAFYEHFVIRETGVSRAKCPIHDSAPGKNPRTNSNRLSRSYGDPNSLAKQGRIV